MSLINVFVRCRDTTKIELKIREEEQTYRQEEQTKAHIEAQKKEKITVGYKPICPFCMAEVANTFEGLQNS